MAGGEVVVETLGSKVLKGNPLGDPTLREIAVYLPPKYDPYSRSAVPCPPGLNLTTNPSASPAFDVCAA